MAPAKNLKSRNVRIKCSAKQQSNSKASIKVHATQNNILYYYNSSKHPSYKKLCAQIPSVAHVFCLISSSESMTSCKLLKRHGRVLKVVIVFRIEYDFWDTSSSVHLIMIRNVSPEFLTVSDEDFFSTTLKLLGDFRMVKDLVCSSCSLLFALSSGEEANCSSTASRLELEVET